MDTDTEMIMPRRAASQSCLSVALGYLDRKYPSPADSR
jgi:hypothetical protein